RVDRDAFARGALIDAVVAFEVRDERGDAIFANWTDAYAVAPVRVVQRTRLRVDHVEQVALDEEAARAAERVARLEVLAVLIEDLEPMVAAIRDPQTASRIEHQRMRRAELTVLHADRAPRLDELAVRGELADPAGRAALEAVVD